MRRAYEGLELGSQGGDAFGRAGEGFQRADLELCFFELVELKVRRGLAEAGFLVAGVIFLDLQAVVDDVPEPARGESDGREVELDFEVEVVELGGLLRAFGDGVDEVELGLGEPGRPFGSGSRPRRACLRGKLRRPCA